MKNDLLENDTIQDFYAFACCPNRDIIIMQFHLGHCDFVFCVLVWMLDIFLVYKDKYLHACYNSQETDNINFTCGL